MSENDSSVVTITDASFETVVLQSTSPVLVGQNGVGPARD